MKTALEILIENYEDVQVTSDGQPAHIRQDILPAMEQYANQFKIAWKHLDKNEFPKEKQTVLCVFKETFMIQEDIYFNKNKEYFTNLYIAWCSLPVYKA